MNLKSRTRRNLRNSERGQAVVEYVILIVVVALAALLVLTAFSDRIRGMIAGVTNTLGGDAQADTGDTSDMIQNLDSSGMQSDMQ